MLSLQTRLLRFPSSRVRVEPEDVYKISAGTYTGFAPEKGARVLLGPGLCHNSAGPDAFEQRTQCQILRQGRQCHAHRPNQDYTIAQITILSPTRFRRMSPTFIIPDHWASTPLWNYRRILETSWVQGVFEGQGSPFLMLP